MDGGMFGEGVANMFGGPLFAAGDIGGTPTPIPPMGGGGIAG